MMRWMREWLRGRRGRRADGARARSAALARLDDLAESGGSDRPRLVSPPPPPFMPTPMTACDPATPADVLWIIARDHPQLRRWLVANPKASAELLEYVAQAGGPGVREALLILLG